MEVRGRLSADLSATGGEPQQPSPLPSGLGLCEGDKLGWGEKAKPSPPWWQTVGLLVLGLWLAYQVAPQHITEEGKSLLRWFGLIK